MSPWKTIPAAAQVESLNLFSESELYSEKATERPDEEQEAAPPGTKEKLAMRAPKDDGRPARRRLATIKGRNAYRIEEQGREGPPLVVSIRDMTTRTYWRRAELDQDKNPFYELDRAFPEPPPLGEQWLDATSETMER